jgi:hypothetical protein
VFLSLIQKHLCSEKKSERENKEVAHSKVMQHEEKYIWMEAWRGGAQLQLEQDGGQRHQK